MIFDGKLWFIIFQKLDYIYINYIQYNFTSVVDRSLYFDCFVYKFKSLEIWLNWKNISHFNDVFIGREVT